MNFARFNHILIPPTREGRDRVRGSWLAVPARPFVWLYGALSAEGRVLVVLLLFVGTAALEVRTTQTFVLWSALTGVLTSALIIRSAFRMKAVDLVVTSAPRVAAGEPITISVELRNHSDRDYHNVRIRGPFLPWDGAWMKEQPAIPLLPSGGTARGITSVRFVQRGEHQLDTFSAGLVAPFGLTMGPRIFSGSCRFLVIPKLASVERLELPSTARYQPGGVAQASRSGEAMELLGVRPYRPGDPVRDLHTRTWARCGKPHVREYQQEYFTRIGIIVDNDVAHTTDRGFEASVSLAAGVVARLAGGEALIDLLVVGEQLHSFTIGRSLGFLSQALDLLACVERGESFDVDRLVSYLQPHLSRLSTMVLITESDDASRDRLAAAVERHGVNCRVLRVVDDRSLPWRRDRAPRSLRARNKRERVVMLSDIEGQEPLFL